MSEPGSAASVLAGNPGDPNTGAGNSAPPSPAPAPTSWLEGISDPDIKGWATKKEWKSPADALASHRELEKRFSGEKVVVPKDPSDKLAWEAYYKAGGRPDTPDGYELDKVEGVNPEWAKTAAAKLHELGLPAHNARELAKWIEGSKAEAAANAEKEYGQKSSLEMLDLKKEWGAAYDAREEAARRGAALAGFTAEEIDKMERSIGTKATMEKFAAIGSKLTEAPVHGAQNPGQNPYLTPADADRLLSEFKSDHDKVTRYRNGDKAIVAEVERLQKIAVSRG